MPRIIEQGSNPKLQRAAAGAFQGLQFAMQQQKADEERAFARERFDEQKEQSRLNNEYRDARAESSDNFQQQVLDQRQQNAEFGQQMSRERLVLSQTDQGLRGEKYAAQMGQFAKSEEQEAVARRWHLGKLQEGGASPEELAVLGNADISLLESASGQMMLQQELNDGAQRIDGLMQTVFSAMNPDPENPMNPDDPFIVALLEGREGSNGSLKDQAAFRQTLVQTLQKIEEQKADAKERVANVASIEPALEQFNMTIPIAQQGMMNAYKSLYMSGEIEFSDFLGEWAKIEQSKSGGGGQTPGSRYIGSFASRRGTEDAMNVAPLKGDLSTEELFTKAQQTARALDGKAPQTKQSDLSKPPANRGGGPTQADSQRKIFSKKRLEQFFGAQVVSQVLDGMPDSEEGRVRYAIAEARGMIEGLEDGTPTEENILTLAESLLVEFDATTN